MPTALMLQEFGEIVFRAFNAVPYHVGSSLTGKKWRDVDVRLILSDADYEALGFGNPLYSHSNARWRAMALAFSALGREMTGLPIDFQIQQQSLATQQFPRADQHRSALLVVLN